MNNAFFIEHDFGEEKKLSKEDRDKLIQDWKVAKDQLDHFKNLEKELRDKIVFDSDLFDERKEQGTETFNLGNGYKLKATKVLNFKFENEDDAQIALDKLSQLGEISKFKAESLVKFKPELSVTKFKELEENEKDIIEEYLIIKPGSPQLKLVEPK